MKPLVAIVALVFSACLINTSTVQAFQETEVSVLETAEISGSINRSKKNYSSPKAVSPVSTSDRTSIRIPGFGVVGTMPRFNLGLELLYRDEETGAVQTNDTEDISIKGTLKHKF